MRRQIVEVRTVTDSVFCHVSTSGALAEKIWGKKKKKKKNLFSVSSHAEVRKYLGGSEESVIMFLVKTSSSCGELRADLRASQGN